MSLVDRMIGKLADEVASRLRTGDRPAAADPAPTPRPFDAPEFGPGLPMAPRHGDAPPRAFSYPIGGNLATTPRGDQPIGFDALRNLADFCDMVRICIEMRKDQLAGLDWDIVAREEGEGDRYPAEIAAAKAFLQRPDRELPWDTWLRSALEDILVYGALSIYRRRTRGGKLYALELVDGATIKPLIDARGRTPAPPAPAYQQILFGMPYVDLTTGELLYRPKNRRSRTVYGSSPVEWIILTVNWYMRRQTFNLSYYTDGNVPEGVGTVPEGWTPDQIRQFQEWWDATLTGRVEQQRKIRWAGAGFELHKFREMNFEVGHEEWMARVITAAFQVSYQRFVQRVVRATAEQAASEQADMGLEPLKKFVSGVIDEVLAVDFQMPFLRHTFLGGEAADERIEIDRHVRYVEAGIISRDEAREETGKPPLDLPLTRVPTVMTSAGPVPLDGSAAEATQTAEAQGRSGDEARAEDDAEKAAAEDLARWRRKALKAVREGKAERAAQFESTAIARPVHAAIAAKLAAATDETTVRAAFEVAASPFRDDHRGAGAKAGRVYEGTSVLSYSRTLERSGRLCGNGADAGRGDGVPYP